MRETGACQDLISPCSLNKIEYCHLKVWRGLIKSHLDFCPEHKYTFYIFFGWHLHPEGMRRFWPSQCGATVFASFLAPFVGSQIGSGGHRLQSGGNHGNLWAPWQKMTWTPICLIAKPSPVSQPTFLPPHRLCSKKIQENFCPADESWVSKLGENRKMMTAVSVFIHSTVLLLLFLFEADTLMLGRI